MMPLFHVPDIHCDACIRGLTNAVRALDADAVLEADLQTKQVRVTSTAPGADLVTAIHEAGFTIKMP